jgi:type IV pilus assembly protein PilW
MAHLHILPRRPLGRRQRGLTLIEFMVSITIGLIMVAALAALIADQSSNRAEVDRAGRLIENGRYAIRAMTDDLQLAGYWGEMNGAPDATALTALPDPCSLTVAGVSPGTQLHVQGYSAASFTNPPATMPTCINNLRSGTDILVVRHVDPDISSLVTGGVPDLTKLTDGQLYIQTGLNAASAAFTSVVNIGSLGTNTATFTLKKKDLATTATVRKVVVRIYYVANCSVEVSGSCTGADGGNPIPTLKMLELSSASGSPAWASAITIAEGIENLQIDYGVDGADADGGPNGDDVDGTALTHVTWPDVMAVKIYVLSRGLEKTPGFADGKTYKLGTAGDFTPATAAPADVGYKRQLFVQSVRMVNPSSRRSS